MINEENTFFYKRCFFVFSNCKFILLRTLGRIVIIATKDKKISIVSFGAGWKSRPAVVKPMRFRARDPCAYAYGGFSYKLKPTVKVWMGEG